MSTSALQTLRDRLIALHGEARSLGQHHIAYHALAAVLHAAEALRDFATLQLVEQRSREHGDWLSRLTAASARLRMKAENAIRK